MLQKEERIIVLLLIISLASLSLFYLLPAAKGEAPEYSNSSRVGQRVSATGVVIAKQPTKTGENLIIELNSNSTNIKLYIPKSAGAKELAKRIKIGDRIRAYGLVQEYKGEREVVISSADEVINLSF
ncbi:MAG: OB-fold nucleic acid binding domain-containing protein [Methanocellales archaeon]